MTRSLLGALIAAPIAFGATMATAADLPETKLKVIGGFGITTQSKLLEQPFWKKTITEKSGGAITADIRPWNEMGLKGAELFRLVAKGTVDAATGYLGHMAGDSPINEGMDLAGQSPTYEDFEKVTAAFRPTLEAHYMDKLGLKILGVWSYQAQVLFCRDELKTLAGLKGRKIRVSGASQSEFISHFGGSGIPMSFGEVQQSLSKGVIDCAITGTLGGYKAKWVEGTKHLYPLPVSWGSIAFAINAKKWASLDPKVQAVLQTNIAELEKSIWEQNREEHQIGINCSTSGPCPHGKAAGLALGKVQASDEANRRKALEMTVLPKWAARCGSACAAQWNKTVGKMVGLKAPE
jgi:TRAP-type C4-dicarboxylate transport system substrate-binding protein